MISPEAGGSIESLSKAKVAFPLGAGGRPQWSKL